MFDFEDNDVDQANFLSQRGLSESQMRPAPPEPVWDWRWVGEEWVHDPVPEAAPVPAYVTPLQLRRALRATQLSTVVTAYIETLTEAEKEDWEYATRIERADPLIETARIALGLTLEQADDLFRLAATF